MKQIQMIATFAAVASVATVASAAVINVSQTRDVQARASFMPNASDSTILVGPWISSVTQTSDGFSSGGTATQNTLVSDTRFAGTGTISAQDDVQGTSGGARSGFFVTFDVVTPTDYSLVGSWNVSHDFNSTNPAATMRFERISPDAEVFHNSFFFDNTFSGGGFANSGSVNLAGVLPAGRYRFEVFVDLTIFRNPGIFSGNGSFAFDLVVPAPGAVGLAGLAGLVSLRRKR
jgi:hypothetical protein